MKNEAGRYLDAWLNWHQFMDEIFVFDDQSDDGSPRIVEMHDRECVVSDGSISFMENEGLFRQAAWEAMEAALKPTEEDWILCLDVDEFLVSNGLDGNGLQAIAAGEADAISLPIPEVFDVQSGIPMIRTDGWWAGMHAPRLFRYQPGGSLGSCVMGGGAVPLDVNSRPNIDYAYDLAILHYGYADPEDRMGKYLRYQAAMERHGTRMNGSHINSILQSPSLTPWAGEVPYVYRGEFE